MTAGLGRHQRAIVATMLRHGGFWPSHWSVHRGMRQSFDGLHRRGVIEPVILRHHTREKHTWRLVHAYRLTKHGRVVKP